MNASLLPLPDRPLSLKQGSLSTPGAYYWSTPILLVVLVFMLLWEGPGLVRDITISQNPVTLDTVDIRDGKCKTHRGFFTNCEAHLSYSYNGREYDSDVEMFFVDFHTGDYESGAVISGDHPELATLSLGLDKLWNRIILLAVFVVFLAGMVIGMTFLAVRSWFARASLRRPARLSPIPVEITAVNTNRRGFFVTYADKISERKTGRSAFTRFDVGQEPLVIGEHNGKAVGLAVWHDRTALPVLLDRQLERIADLTPGERAAALDHLPSDEVSQDARDQMLAEPPKKSMSILKRILIFFTVILLCAIGLFGYWLWYVTSSETQFVSPAMDINNMMPAALNEWGCDKLKQRFGHDRAPFGCTAEDFMSWK